MNRRIVLGILVVIVLVVGALAVGGIGYRIGVVQGLSANPQLVSPQGNGNPVVPYYYGAPYFYRGPWGFGWGGFGFLGCLFPLLGILLFFFLIRALFWGRGWRRGWGGHGYGPGGWQDFGPGGQGVPPMFSEWHNRAHNPQQPEQPKPEGQGQ
jgi:hypothetical protein